MQRILLVDDDPDIRANICDILEAFQFDVKTAANGEEALELAQQQRFDVVLLDYKMPGMDGADLYRRLRNIQPSAVAIMMTGYAGSDGVQRALDAGTWKVLRKPVNVDMLLNLIQVSSQQPLVLVVDDDHEFCNALWDALRTQGIRVGLAHHADDALAEVTAQKYNVVLLDLALEQSRGEDILDQLSKHEMPPVVVVTGQRPSPEATRRLIEQGASNVCLKPVDVDHIVQLIKTASAP